MIVLLFLKAPHNWLLSVVWGREIYRKKLSKMLGLLIDLWKQKSAILLHKCSVHILRMSWSRWMDTWATGKLLFSSIFSNLDDDFKVTWGDSTINNSIYLVYFSLLNAPYFWLGNLRKNGSEDILSYLLQEDRLYFLAQKSCCLEHPCSLILFSKVLTYFPTSRSPFLHLINWKFFIPFPDFPGDLL